MPSSVRDDYKTLYSRPVQSTRGGPLFNAFPYSTKISPEAIALFIATHTAPGGMVLDSFAGSGSTGIAAILCGCPTAKMRQEADRLGLSVSWGARRAVLYELGVLGSFVASVLCCPPDPDEFGEATEQLVHDVRQEWAWLYRARDPDGKEGEIRYIVWSDTLSCPTCRKRASLWDACVSRKPANISAIFSCPHCQSQSALDCVSRIRKSIVDDLLKTKRTTRHRIPAWVYGQTDGHTWSRRATAMDLKLCRKIEGTKLPHGLPVQPIPWGDLHRSGYHEGMSHLHHFYTRRNLLAFSAMWEATDRYPEHLRPSLRFWLLSYNAAHSTVMTRVVAKKGQDDLVVTSAQPGVLYVSGLPVEKNIFAGLRRKSRTMQQAFRLTHGHDSLVSVRNASCMQLDMPNETIDYVFTDPPFGGNIPYAEVNFINEAWLGKLTDTKDEAIVSPHQEKTVEDYQDLLRRAFSEACRVLRPDGNATVVFHSTSAQVWNALRTACEQAGFDVADTSILDKTQGSFKQVRTVGAVKGDPLILLKKTSTPVHVPELDVWSVTDRLMEQAIRSDDRVEVTAQRLYSRLVGHYVAVRQNVPIGAGDFYRQLGERRAEYAVQPV